MAGRILFTQKEYILIKYFLLEHNMYFGGKYGIPMKHWDDIMGSAIGYLENNTEGKAKCPFCDRLFIATDEDGFGWCIKCDWRNTNEKQTRFGL